MSKEFIASGNIEIEKQIFYYCKSPILIYNVDIIK